MRRAIVTGIAAMALSATFATKTFAVEVYLFKGAGDFSFVSENLHFSRGLNKIADTLNAEGIHAEVRRFSAIEDALATIRRRKPESVAFIGHSMGALASMAIARNLRGQGIRIAYMGLIDIPGPVGTAGDNVEWVQNYYSINPVYGKLTNVKSHPRAKNIHVGGYIHNRMDDAPKVQNGMLEAIRAIHREENGDVQTVPPVETLEAGLPVREVQVQTITRAEVSAPAQQPTSAPQSSPNVAEVTVPQPSPNGGDVTIVQTEEAPYVLPSVAGELPAGVESQDPLLANVQNPAYVPPSPTSANVPPLPIQDVDPVTTASVPREGLLQRGKRFLRNTGAFVRGLSSGNRQGVNRPNYQSDR